MAASAAFETITIPEVLAVYPARQPWACLENVPTSREIVIVFNEQVAWDHSLLKIEPPVEVTTGVESLASGQTAVRIKPPGRWENSTRYALTVDGAVKTSTAIAERWRSRPTSRPGRSRTC